MNRYQKKKKNRSLCHENLGGHIFLIKGEKNTSNEKLILLINFEDRTINLSTVTLGNNFYFTVSMKHLFSVYIRVVDLSKTDNRLIFKNNSE